MNNLPEYTIRPNVTRVLVPSTIITAILAVVFYAGVSINLSLLGIRIPGSIRILIIAVLALLVVIEALLTYLKASKMQYSVYRNRIQIEGPKQEYVMFNDVQEMKQKKNFFDKMFNTGTIVIEPKMKIKAVPNFDQTFVYVKQMMQYSRMQYSRV